MEKTPPFKPGEEKGADKREDPRDLSRIPSELWSSQNSGMPAQRRRKIADKTVGNYMRELGIKAQYVKPYTVTTIRPDLSSRLRNILKEKFNPEEPDAVWCSDITYIWTYEGFVYLTSIMDLYSRKIISWVLM